MRRSLYFVVLLLALAAMAVACGGGGGEESEVSPTAEATGTPEAEMTPEAEPTPGVTATVRPSPAITVVPGARLAVMPLDVQAFLAQFVDNIPSAASCDYDDEMALVDCTEAGHDKFQVVPPLPDTVIQCTAGVLDDEVVWVTCVTELSVFYYEVVEE